MWWRVLGGVFFRSRRQPFLLGDWGRNALIAVATRHLGWRLVEVVRKIPGLVYGAAAQGIRRFWMQLPQDPGKAKFLSALISEMSNVEI